MNPEFLVLGFFLEKNSIENVKGILGHKKFYVDYYTPDSFLQVKGIYIHEFIIHLYERDLLTENGNGFVLSKSGKDYFSIYQKETKWEDYVAWELIKLDSKNFWNDSKLMI